MMSGRIIVLGAGGFMGRAVWRVLAQDPRCNHLAVHFRRPPDAAMLAHRADTWSALDLAEATPTDIVDMIRQSEADVVVNCAGATRGSLDELRSGNVEITAKVSSALTALGHVHLIHLGSAAEYGAHRTGEPITENTPARPVSDYGVTKLEATRHLVAAGRAGRLTATVLRVFNPLGRGSAASTLPGRAAQEIHAAVRRGDDSITLGSLESWRDYIDARDVGGAVAAAVQTVPDGATVLNVGRGEAVHTRESGQAPGGDRGVHGADHRVGRRLVALVARSLASRRHQGDDLIAPLVPTSQHRRIPPRPLVGYSRRSPRMKSRLFNRAGRVFVAVSLITSALVVGSGMPAAHAAAAPPAPDIAQKVAVPAYINPLLDPAAWAQLATSSPGAMGFAVANVINGPDYTPFSEWSQVIQSVSASGVKVVGYVDTGYLGTTGQRTRLGSTDPVDWMSQIQHDVDTWYRFYGSSLSGIFFDQTQNACGPDQGSNAWADLYKRLSDNVERLYPGSVTVLNPGIAVPQCYESAGDVLVTFEGSYASYVGDPSATNRYTPLSWTPVDPMKIWHIVYDAPDATTMRNTIALSKSRGAGYIYVTDDGLANPYDTLPPVDYWAAELAAVLTLPDLRKAPSPPATLDTVEVWATSVALDWVGTRKGPGVAAAYDIYRDGVLLDSVPATTTTYTAVDLTPLSDVHLHRGGTRCTGSGQQTQQCPHRADRSDVRRSSPTASLLRGVGHRLHEHPAHLGASRGRRPRGPARCGCLRRAAERPGDPAPAGVGDECHDRRSRARFDLRVLRLQRGRLGATHSRFPGDPGDHPGAVEQRHDRSDERRRVV